MIRLCRLVDKILVLHIFNAKCALIGEGFKWIAFYS